MAEFRFFFAEDESEFMMLKWHADAALDIRAPRLKAEPMPSKETTTTLDAYWARLRHHPVMRDISGSPEEIRKAHMCEGGYTGTVNARTEYTLPDGTEVRD
eukprot:SAG22_NODE_1929_length_3293_cov_3.309956_2_plen_101_part_00